MNSGYFTSRHEILEWINGLLKLELTKVEQLGSGHVYCHILDAAYPGKVPMNKVKWNAFLEVDFLHNFKVLQTCFEKLGIHKSIDVHLMIFRLKS
jgi:RP/EB family microtubule-associated protein